MYSIYATTVTFIVTLYSCWIMQIFPLRNISRHTYMDIYSLIFSFAINYYFLVPDDIYIGRCIHIHELNMHQRYRRKITNLIKEIKTID